MWLIVLGGAAVLASRRYSAAMGSSRPDLEGIFLPAASAVRQGVSPYETPGYVYSPIVAQLLSLFPDTGVAVRSWTAMTLALAICSAFFVTRSFAGILSATRQSLVFGLACVTLLASWPLSWELWLGQTDLVSLCGICLAIFGSRNARASITGTGLALGAAVKTWPILFWLWFARRQDGRHPRVLAADPRVRAAAWATIVTCALLIASFALQGGLSGVGMMARRTVEFSSQPLAAYSALGAGRLLFRSTPVAPPIAVSAVLQWTTTLAIAAVALLLMAITLLLPADDSLALPNIAFCVILLLPVSHLSYLILPLPAMWLWGGRALAQPRNRLIWLVLAVFGCWWFLALRTPAVGDGAAHTSFRSYLTILLATLVTASVSVVASWVLGHQPSPHPAPD